ncbi:MAG: acetyl/propionyl/methylcrotonyl-CoA carboxylase subunit alpha [Ilumatobacteraceae bacterium]
MRILIANRGEIARRIIRSARLLGHETVAVYADPDRDAPFTREADIAVRIGPADLASSYLSIDAVIAALHATGADAVHPGYGFLAENAAFADAVIAADATWIGPNPTAIREMGSKIRARRLAMEAGVPVIPGFDESQDPADLAAAADRIGYPVLVKAAAGGGGKGIRIVHEAAGFAAALTEATTEAERSFGDGAMIVERYIQRPRHIEVQVVGDRHGNVVHLGTRECSVQRRYQKVLEEAPAPNLSDKTRSGLQDSAVALAAAIGYDSAGTVEFVVDDETGNYFFLEMNTRLQVEHPVTEAVTGLDLVGLMFAVAEGAVLPIAQSDVAWCGHAFEARINAEDPFDGFAPRIGTVTHLCVPEGVRWDSAVEVGGEITPHYDSMVAKLIVHGDDRGTALRRLGSALDALIVGGLVTNTALQRWLCEAEPVRAGRVTTRFLDETPLPDPKPVPVEAAAAAWLATVDGGVGATAWSSLVDRRVGPHRPVRVVALRDLDGVMHEVVPDGDVETSATTSAIDVDTACGSVAVNVAGATHTFTVVPREERWAPTSAAGHGHASAVIAPFPGVVTSVDVSPGDSIDAGSAVVVIEAMKMLHTLSATGPGVVAEVRVSPGDQVATSQILVTFEPENPS